MPTYLEVDRAVSIEIKRRALDAAYSQTAAAVDRLAAITGRSLTPLEHARARHLKGHCDAIDQEIGDLYREARATPPTSPRDAAYRLDRIAAEFAGSVDDFGGGVVKCVCDVLTDLAAALRTGDTAPWIMPRLRQMIDLANVAGVEALADDLCVVLAALAAPRGVRGEEPRQAHS